MDPVVESPAPTPEETPLLPEGWTEAEDLFSEPSPADPAEAERSPDAGLFGASETADDAGERPDTEADAALPTTESAQKSPAKLRFTARVDHRDRLVELDESELPALYQKAQVTERTQKRLKELSAALGETSLREAAEAPAAAPDAPRDFGRETEELLAVFPQMRGRSLPTEVVLASLRDGRSLTAAFAEYSERQHQAELSALREERRVSRQNDSASRRSPVRGTAGGGAEPKPSDPFLAGFESERW